MTTAPRFAAFAFAAVMTLSMLLGVGHLADTTPAAAQLAQGSTLHTGA